MKVIKVKNREEIDTWLFEHAQIQRHNCIAIKGTINNEILNIAFKDTDTTETITIIYE